MKLGWAGAVLFLLPPEVATGDHAYPPPAPTPAWEIVALITPLLPDCSLLILSSQLKIPWAGRVSDPSWSSFWSQIRAPIMISHGELCASFSTFA